MKISIMHLYLYFPQMKFNFWKCDASGNPDSCEYMLKDFEAKDICRVMTKSGELWSVFMNSFEKFPYCPIVPVILNVF